MAKNTNKNILVEKETFEKDDKTYFSFFIKGVVRGKEIKVAVVPPDRGSYAVLDVGFGNEMKANLVVKPFVIQRKIFQTSGSEAGAEYTTKIFSIVQTCNMCNINVEHYLNYVLDNIDTIEVEKLLPYSKEIKDTFWCELKSHWLKYVGMIKIFTQK